MKVRMHFVGDRLDTAKKRKLLGAAGAADVNADDTFAREKRLMLLAGRDFRTHAENLDGVMGNEALILAGHAARHHDHVAILTGVEQRLIQPRGESEDEDEDHRDQRDAENRHQRRRAPLDDTANIVANRHHRTPLTPISPDWKSTLTPDHFSSNPRLA